jgi:hypothetical protein
MNKLYINIKTCAVSSAIFIFVRRLVELLPLE